MDSELPFDESRRLTGSSIYFDGPGVALEALGASRLDEAALSGWQSRIRHVRAALGWPQEALVIRRHASGASLAFAAPLDQLYIAATVNEWAWLASLHTLGGGGFDSWHLPGHPVSWDTDSTLHGLRAMAGEEANPPLIALLEAARLRGVPAHPDDDALTLGEGVGSRTWPVRELPAADEVPWHALHGIPLAVVTGSNGKTTTVRLLAAMARAHGWRTGYSSTDGLFIDGERLDSGDYSGPVGARTVLRQPALEAAILETARGGLLRRGIAINHARVALVTNISPDHFGEYGIHSLDDLAQVKLSVVGALDADGLLVLNADDPLLVQRGTGLARRAWFALDHDHPRLRCHRGEGGMTCGVRDGRLILTLEHGALTRDVDATGRAPVEHDLGPVAAMPVTLGGSAAYNIANIAAAALAAVGMGIDAGSIADVLARFGELPGDNPGRLQRWRYGDAPGKDSPALQVFVDYAHNPDGLRGLLRVASHARGAGRFGLLLGQAGNREDRDIRALAAVAAEFRPDRVWLKDIGGEYMRGRTVGEIAEILRDELLLQGMADESLVVCLEETRAVRDALAWSQPGDLLVLPVHEPEARDEVVAFLDDLHARGWSPGQALTMAAGLPEGR